MFSLCRRRFPKRKKRHAARRLAFKRRKRTLCVLFGFGKRKRTLPRSAQRLGVCSAAENQRNQGFPRGGNLAKPIFERIDLGCGR